MRESLQDVIEEEAEMNMTPMIDVVFLLIIFFLCITAMTQQGVEDLQLPTAGPAVAEHPDHLRRLGHREAASHADRQRAGIGQALLALPRGAQGPLASRTQAVHRPAQAEVRADPDLQRPEQAAA